MRIPTQGLLLMFLGAVLLRLAGSDAYLRYVVPWMKWPLLVSGVLLILMALGPLFRDEPAAADDGDGHEAHDAHGHGVPKVTWLLALPGVIAFVISPPELGSYLAERRANDLVSVSAPASVTVFDGEGPVELALEELLYLAQSGEPSLEDQPVVVTGFVSYGAGEDWYVTRMQIGCCAADAMAYRVLVNGAERPERDQWVRVTGVHVTGTGTEPPFEVELDAQEVVEIDAPRQTYE